MLSALFALRGSLNCVRCSNLKMGGQRGDIPSQTAVLLDFGNPIYVSLVLMKEHAYSENGRQQKRTPKALHDRVRMQCATIR